jgi:hypothetical protein
MPLRQATAAERESARERRQEKRRQEKRRRRMEQVSATVDALLAESGPLPSWALAHAGKARKGRILSLVVLKCGDCCAWERSEITHCEVTACPLHPVRPYQPGG